jgi:hypothetical protein
VSCNAFKGDDRQTIPQRRIQLMSQHKIFFKKPIIFFFLVARGCEFE